MLSIGVPKERKQQEYRVSLIPELVTELVATGVEIFVEHNAGIAAGFDDNAYLQSGAKIVEQRELHTNADLICKIKEPQTSEYEFFREGQLIFGYLHIAANRPLLDQLIEKRVDSIAVEAIKDEKGTFPCLTPMSNIAGILAVQEAAYHTTKHNPAGRGMLLGGVTGFRKSKVVVIGCGVAGISAIKTALGLGANVIAIDLSAERLAYVETIFNSRVETTFSTPTAITNALKTADIVIGAIYVPATAAPKVIKAEQVRKMPRGSVIVDIAIDQGGCVETSRPTTHNDPTYVAEGVVHYCVQNIPSLVAYTASQVYGYSIMPWLKNLCLKGLVKACSEDKGLANAVVTSRVKFDKN